MSSDKQPVIACRLTADDLAGQVERWARLRREAQIAQQTIEAGVRLTFEPRPEVELELRVLVAVENECCPWATWTIASRTHPPELALEVTSTGDGIAAAQALFKRAV
jgi:hypothetical protein